MRDYNNNNNFFVVGTTVQAKNNLSEKLFIRRYVDGIYYCKLLADPAHKDLVYFERELMTAD